MGSVLTLTNVYYKTIFNNVFHPSLRKNIIKQVTELVQFKTVFMLGSALTFIVSFWDFLKGYLQYLTSTFISIINNTERISTWNYYLFDISLVDMRPDWYAKLFLHPEVHMLVLPANLPPCCIPCNCADKWNC